MKKSRRKQKVPEDNNQEAPQLSRRNFLKFGLGALASAAVIESGIMSFMYLKSRADETRVDGIITAGNLEKFIPGSITEFEKEGFFVLCTEECELLAISSRCPHLGCSVIWEPEDERFICPCHASSFDLYGNFESRPVPRPLDIYEITIEDSKVLVDKSRVIVREKFETKQLTPLQTSAAEVHDE
jgi:cytochrome b6-f complex iron-sulfur subunit